MSKPLSDPERAVYFQEYRGSNYKVPDPSPKLKLADRKCMACYIMFESTWIGNRICEVCSGKEIFRS